MNTSALRTIRWLLIVFLSVLLCYLLYLVIAGVASITHRSESMLNAAIQLAMYLLMTTLLATIPGIALHSLLTKRLNGLSACIGLVLAIGGFSVAVSLPRWLHLFEALNSVKYVPDIFKVMIGLPLCIVILLFPFWYVRKIIALTNNWLYPKILKPMEEKI